MAVDVDLLSDVIDFKTVLVKVPIDEGKYHRQGHVAATKSRVAHTKRRIKRNVQRGHVAATRLPVCGDTF